VAAKVWMPVEKRSYASREAALGARRKALGYARFEVLEGGRTWKEAARDMGAGERTLRRWRQLERSGGFVFHSAGRPRKRLGAIGRREVLRLLVASGPSLGVSPLRRRFEGLSRAEGREIVGKYRDHYRRTHPRVVFELRWLVPEAVWALDFTELSCGRSRRTWAQRRSCARSSR
jgi:Helix-turn-helix domain